MATAVTQPQEPEVKQNEPEKDPETGKFIYTYQPRDAEGQFIGKPYRFLYTDHQDLIRQLTDAKANGDRFIHEVKTGKRKLHGEPAQPVPEFKPAPEDADEAERKRREDFRKTAEKEFGAPVETVRETFKKATTLSEKMTAYLWAMNKQAEGYYPCPENAKTISDWLAEKNLAYSPANYDLAFEELKDKLVQAPREQAPADSTQQQPPPTRTEEVKPRSTGIMPGQFAGTRQPTRTDKQALSMERFRQIDKMSRDQWKRLQRENPKEAETFLAMKFPAQPQQ
jgi:hypothetical protein